MLVAIGSENLLGRSTYKKNYVYKPLTLNFPAFLGKNKRPNEDYFKNNIVDKKMKRKGELGNLANISFFVRKLINEEAYKKGMSNDSYLRKLLKGVSFMPQIATVDSRSANIGRTRVTSLMDGEQIFDKTLKHLNSAEKSIQIELFDFQNVTVNHNYQMVDKVKSVPGAKEQQMILNTLIKKKQENPEMKIQVVMDAHKWYVDNEGTQITQRHYANAYMMKYLKMHGIDVVPYPRAAQQGANLQHGKLLIVDGKKAIVGGMNWGTHSPVNHDACVAIETLKKYKNSEVDNLMRYQFNPDWKFAWQRLGATRLMSGPLNKEEQKNYRGLDMEIKAENVQYYNLLKDLFDTDEMRNRYTDGKLDIIPSKPVETPKISVLGTKPRELNLVGEHGIETTREALLNKFKTCKKIRAELFVLTDKEIVKTIIKRTQEARALAKKEGKKLEDFFDAEFLVEPGIIENLSYTELPFTTLQNNNIKIRTFKGDKKLGQKLHGKWIIFDDAYIVIGSTNMSGVGLNQNLKTGIRKDYELNSKAIIEEIKGYLDKVKSHEEKLNIPSLNWTTRDKDFNKLLTKNKLEYNQLIERRKLITSALKSLHDNGEAKLIISDKSYHFKDNPSKEIESELQTVLGYYGIIKKRYNAQEKYKRGNNEVSVMFESKTLAKQVFDKQFVMDWRYSESPYSKAVKKAFKIGQFWSKDRIWA